MVAVNGMYRKRKKEIGGGKRGKKRKGMANGMERGQGRERYAMCSIRKKA